MNRNLTEYIALCKSILWQSFFLSSLTKYTTWESRRWVLYTPIMLSSWVRPSHFTSYHFLVVSPQKILFFGILFTIILLYFSLIVSSYSIKDKSQQLPPWSSHHSVVPHFVFLRFVIRSGKATLRTRLQSKKAAVVCLRRTPTADCACQDYVRTFMVATQVLTLRDSHLHLLVPTHDKHQGAVLCPLAGVLCCSIVSLLFLCWHMFSPL